MKCSEGEGVWDLTLGNQGRPHWQSGLRKDKGGSIFLIR